MPQFTVSKELQFSSGHYLREYHGKCENPHGHNYKLKVYLAAEKLGEEGMVIDFLELEKLMVEIVHPFDHKVINDIPPFDKTNPTAENLAKYFFEQMIKRIDFRDIYVDKVEVWETDNNCAIYSSR